MIASVSHRLALMVGKYAEREEDTDYIRYGLEIIIGGLLKMTILFSVAYLFSVLQPMVWAFCTFAFFRSLTGGHHYSTYGRCLVAGLIMLIGIAYISVTLKDVVPLNYVNYLLYCVSIYGFILAYKYAPSNHFYKKCTEKQKHRLRKFSFIAIFCWFFLVYYLLKTTYTVEILLASILGFIFQVSSLHPHTYKFVEKIEKLLERGLGLHEKIK